MPEVAVHTLFANSFAVSSATTRAVEFRVYVRINLARAGFGSIATRIDPGTVNAFPIQRKEEIHISSSETVAQWRRVARLARIAVPENEIVELCAQLNSIMAFVDHLDEVDVTGVEPMTSVTPMKMKSREDKVTDGGIADKIIANAPAHEHHFFLVPKVVE